jgi:hypothetical protein
MSQIFVGYFCIETPLIFVGPEERIQLRKLLDENNLAFVGQVHTDPYGLPDSRWTDVKVRLIFDTAHQSTLA